MNDPSRPRRGELLTIAVFAIALRVAVCLINLFGLHVSVAAYTAKGDTSSYKANAAVMTGERSLKSLSDYDTRVFPGYPAMIAVVHRIGVPLTWSALWVTWICTGVAAAAAGKVFNDARIAWAMTCLIPHYLINSSLGMSEAPMLAVICLGLLASQRDRLFLAGVLFGMAGMIRPMACFALAGLMFALVREGRWKSAVTILYVAVGMFGVEVLVLQLWTGDALRGVHVYAQHPGAYAGHPFGWPFQSLLTTPHRDAASIGRVVYIWVHVILAIVVAGVSADRALRAGRSRPRDAVSFVWQVSNTAFVLCIGGVWGFRHFPRFIIPAEPAMFWTLRNYLPRNPRWWVLIGSASMVAAILGVLDSP